MQLRDLRVKYEEMSGSGKNRATRFADMDSEFWKGGDFHEQGVCYNKVSCEIS